MKLVDLRNQEHITADVARIESIGVSDWLAMLIPSHPWAHEPEGGWLDSSLSRRALLWGLSLQHPRSMGLRTSAEVQRYRGALQYRASLGAGRSGGSATYPEAALDVTIRNQNQN